MITIEYAEVFRRYGLTEKGLDMVFTGASIALKHEIEIIAKKYEAINTYKRTRRFPRFNVESYSDEQMARLIMEHHESIDRACEYLHSKGKTKFKNYNEYRNELICTGIKERIGKVHDGGLGGSHF